MPKMINLTDTCYSSLEALKTKIKEEKKKSGKPVKTTFSELICMMMREREASTQC